MGLHESLGQLGRVVVTPHIAVLVAGKANPLDSSTPVEVCMAKHPASNCRVRVALFAITYKQVALSCYRAGGFRNIYRVRDDD